MAISPDPGFTSTPTVTVVILAVATWAVVALFFVVEDAVEDALDGKV